MTSLRVMKIELLGTCWKSLLKASQEVQRDSTTGGHIWGRTSLGERVSSCNRMSNNTLPTGTNASTHTHKPGLTLRDSAGIVLVWVGRKHLKRNILGIFTMYKLINIYVDYRLIPCNRKQLFKQLNVI